MVIATALGWGTAASIALAVGLAFSAGYALTALPLLRLGMPFATAAPIVLRRTRCRLRSWRSSTT